MSRSGKESSTIRAAGGPCPGSRSGLVSPRPGRLRMLIVAVCAASLLAPLGFVVPGCSSKPTVKKKGKGSTARKREETGLAELAAAESAATTPPSAASEASATAEPAATATADADVAVAEPVATDAASEPADASAAAVPPSTESVTPRAEAAPSTADAAASEASLDGLAATGAGSEHRPTSKLVDADTALLLDGGRVEVCSPLGWARSPRSQNYLVRYQPGPRKSYPSIVVTAEPSPEGLGEITAANQADLVAAIGTKLAETFPAGGTVKLIKRPAAASFGPHAGVAWAMPGTAKVSGLSEPIERFAYGVVLGGRLYTVEARAPKGKVDDDARAAAKAVAATLFRPAAAPAGEPEGTAEVGAGPAAP